ncbi:MAG: putative rane protein, partial [Armatimonadetes bacterium]|nr:putative rane protein [Armatimonadota bacterium]
LGIDPGQDTLRLDRLFFVQPTPLAITVAAGLGLVAWVLLFYARDGSRPSWFWKALMVTLRLAAITILVLLIWQPMLRSQRVERTPSIVALLIDESRSMALTDRWQDSKRKADLIQALGNPNATKQTRAEVLSRLVNKNDAAMLRELVDKHSVRVYRFGADTAGKDVAAGDAKSAAKKPAAPKGQTGLERLPLSVGKPAAEQTRIGNAIDHVLEDTAGQPLAAMVLFSDGGQNMGEDPALAARRAAEIQAPIYSVGFGDPTPPRDVAVTSLLADEVVRKGDEVVVSISIRNRGYGGTSVPVTLKIDDRVLARQNVPLAKEGQKQELNLSFTPDTAGAKTLSVSIPGQGGEITLSNNQKSWPIRVVDKKLRILYVEGYPRWEYRYLKNAILRDKTTLFSCILVESDPTLGGEGNQPIYGFPRDRKALFNYDIIILGDVPRDFFSAADMKNIRGFVEERGGSLITMAGELFLPWQYRNTDLEEVWPIPVPATRRELLFTEPFQLELTDAGARNPMMFLLPDVDRNRNLWHALPGMYWCGVADRAKPGATVLAQHPSQMGTDGKIPLLAVQQAGEGTSFMTMVDSTWQWRYRVGDKYFYRFWGQIVRSLTPHELPGANRFVRLTADRSTYSLGEKVVLRARLLTPNFHPVRVKEVISEMQRTDGQRFPVKLDPVPGAAGVYSGEWLPSRAGAYKALLMGPNGQRAESTTNVVVEASSLELDEPQQNEALLKRVAALSGGKYLLWSQYAGLAGLIPDRAQEVSTRIEHELWDAPLPLILFTLLLVGEWILRKRKGLL